ncbi:hypothetical protein HHL11_23000 [Ramlibacter sp. G-1-2-2]|uniref:SLATT domain-containing protein n=1 Tax=Ramlibacter agri TaxID=2728837 RepID=A0A848H9H2_9BURK|nr:hypothetical protein [Ramlibacter agri]NML46632.1 hypothetical protein [Ramlibacter agri]
MDATEIMQHVASAKLREARIMGDAYARTQAGLTPANFLLIVGAALLSLVAGATVIADLLPKITIGAIALFSSALTTIHAKLGCERYQAECRKMQSFYRGIAQDYENLGVHAGEDDLRKRLMQLNDQMSAAVKSSSVEPFAWAVRKADRAVPAVLGYAQETRSETP